MCDRFNLLMRKIYPGCLWWGEFRDEHGVGQGLVLVRGVLRPLPRDMSEGCSGAGMGTWDPQPGQNACGAGARTCGWE